MSALWGCVSPKSRKVKHKPKKASNYTNNDIKYKKDHNYKDTEEKYGTGESLTTEENEKGNHEKYIFNKQDEYNSEEKEDTEKATNSNSKDCTVSVNTDNNKQSFTEHTCFTGRANVDDSLKFPPAVNNEILETENSSSASDVSNTVYSVSSLSHSNKHCLIKDEYSGNVSDKHNLQKYMLDKSCSKPVKSKEHISKSTLETHKLDLMAEISNLKVKLASSERERREMQDKLCHAQKRIDELQSRLNDRTIEVTDLRNKLARSQSGAPYTTSLERSGVKKKTWK